MIIRQNVPLSETTMEKIKKYSSDYAMTKSAFCAYAINAHIKQLEDQSNFMKELKESIKDQAIKQGDLEND